MASIGLNSRLVKTVMLKIIGDGGDANRLLDEIAAKAEALKAEHPELTVSVNRAKAMADAVAMKAEMRRVFGEGIEVPVKLTAFDRFTNLLSFLPGINRMAAGIGGGGAGAGGAAAGGGMFSAIGGAPWMGIGIGTAIGAGALAAPALLGGGFAGLLGAGGIYEAFKQNPNLTSGKAGQYFSLGKQYSNIAADVGKAFEPVAAQLVAFARAVGPALGTLFKDAEPFMKNFIGPLAEALRKMLPYLDDFVKKAAPLGGSLGKSIGLVLVSIAKGLDYLAPAFRASGQIVHVFAAIISGAFDLVARTVSDVTRIVYAIFTGKWKEAFKAAEDIAAYAIKGLHDQLWKVFEFITPWVNRIAHDILQEFKKLPGQLFDIGKNIVMGLIHGMESIPVIGSVWKFSDHLLGSLGRAIGVSSPSTKAMALGRYFTQGFYIGLGQAGGGTAVNVRGYGGGGGQPPVVLQFTGGGGADEFLAQMIRRYVQNHGGGGKNSVQVAFGQVH